MMECTYKQIFNLNHIACWFVEHNAHETRLLADGVLVLKCSSLQAAQKELGRVYTAIGSGLRAAAIVELEHSNELHLVFY
ncbi:hypothetical protein FRD01_02590 [Microvenator marinus]|uniref:Uncharacterized protein n=1 Tax=Microvenator marinus TaxID=2600177 RepID=A0A5B8XKR8_9DELT|nr:hypothetical protein [Microvenator marinus]QED26164.1 hypothetical protein FRD01_02590 [Microvenator marinus]